MFEDILFLICGIMLGNGIRVMYFLFTNKDIPLLKHRYTTEPDGTIKEYENLDTPGQEQ